MLRPRNLALHIEALACALAARILLRFCSLPAAARGTRAVSALFPFHAAEHDCRAAASRAANRLGHDTCLYRALTEYGLLATRMRGVEVHVGAAADRELSAHAWVSVHGLAADAEAERYAPLWTAGARER